MSVSKFGPQTTALEVVEGVDLTNKNYIVTGASSGLGVETARALAKAGARVTIAVRDITKGEEVAKQIRESTNNSNVEAEKLDLSSLDSVNSFVKRYLDKKQPLHGLVNNAGEMACPHSYTKDGFELHFGTNYMGHFALTIGLISALIDAYKQTGKKSRVINVSSILHFLSDIHFDDINYKTREYGTLEAYCQSKTALNLFSVALTELYSKDGIVSNAVMPGRARTRISKHFPDAVQEAWYDEKGGYMARFKKFIKTVEQGAKSI